MVWLLRSRPWQDIPANWRVSGGCLLSDHRFTSNEVTHAWTSCELQEISKTYEPCRRKSKANTVSTRWLSFQALFYIFNAIGEAALMIVTPKEGWYIDADFLRLLAFSRGRGNGQNQNWVIWYSFRTYANWRQDLFSPGRAHSFHSWGDKWEKWVSPNRAMLCSWIHGW